MTPTPEKSHAWHSVRITPSRTALSPTREAGCPAEVSGRESWSCWLLLLAIAMTMTPANERSMAVSSTADTVSPLKRNPRIADQRGFVWKKMMIKVMGMSCKLKVKSKKLVVPKRDLTWVSMNCLS